MVLSIQSLQGGSLSFAEASIKQSMHSCCKTILIVDILFASRLPCIVCICKEPWILTTNFHTNPLPPPLNSAGVLYPSLPVRRVYLRGGGGGGGGEGSVSGIYYRGVLFYCTIDKVGGIQGLGRYRYWVIKFLTRMNCSDKNLPSVDQGSKVSEGLSWVKFFARLKLQNTTWEVEVKSCYLWDWSNKDAIWEVDVTKMLFGRLKLQRCYLGGYSYKDPIWEVEVTKMLFGRLKLQKCYLGSWSYKDVICDVAVTTMLFGRLKFQRCYLGGWSYEDAIWKVEVPKMLFGSLKLKICYLGDWVTKILFGRLKLRSRYLRCWSYKDAIWEAEVTKLLFGRYKLLRCYLGGWNY